MILVACGERASDAKTAAAAGPAAAPSAPGTPTATPTVVRRWPHSLDAYTEGLEFHAGQLYESTGIEGRSSVRIIHLPTGAVVRERDLPPPFFGEGITIFRGKLYQLTWKSGKGFIYDAATLAPRGTFAFYGEGWGLTHDSGSLIMSDGTNTLRFLDPTSFAVRRTLQVSDNGQPVQKLNELEWVEGEIYANVWQSDQIARIDPASGRVLGWLELSELLDRSERTDSTEVLNGIAYDSAARRLFVTGKRWPAIFEIRVKGLETRD